MKNKLPLILALASSLGAPLVLAQEDRPPLPPEGQRPPTPPEGERPPAGERGPKRPEGERGPGRPNLEREGPRSDGERGPGKPGGDRGPGGPEGGRRSEGDRPFSPRGESGARENPGRERAAARPQKPTPYLGVMTMPVPPAMGAQIGLPEGFGIVVEEVVPESPAATAGVQRYDVLKLINDQQLIDPNQLAVLVRSYGKDHEITLTILRKGQEQKLTLKVGERMLPERNAALSPGEFSPRFDAMRERGEQFGRQFQEGMRGFPDRVREYQKKIEEWRKNPAGSEPPPAPQLQPPGGPNAPGGPGAPDGPRPPEPPRPADLLREARPGGAPQVRVDQDGAVTTWNTAQAHVVVKDEKGEIEVRSQDGHRTVTAKNPAGETIFTGPVDTEEQRQALPEPVRRKLAEIHVQSEARGSAQNGGAQAEATTVRSLDEAWRRAQPQPPREIQ